MLMKFICAIFLEKKTKKKDNSCTLPSQIPKDETALSDIGSKGNGKLEHDKMTNNCRTRETATLPTVDTCTMCDEDMTNTICNGHVRRTNIDIGFEKMGSHVDAEIKACNACRLMTKGLFPGDIPSPLQYGPGLKAFTIYLLICQIVALGRLQKTIKAWLARLFQRQRG